MAKILIVDDNVDLLRLIELNLAQAGYRVAIADNGVDGLQLIDEFQPDLIILDIMMPEMDGWEFCELAREKTLIPILMLTARSEDSDIIKGLKIGADEYLTKPFPLSTLAARIEALLRRQNWDEEEAAENIESLKASIISSLSHELRTPVALILNALDLSLREAFRDDLSAQQDFIKEARFNAETLRWLIEDLLLMIRIDEGLEVLVRQSDVHDLVKQIIRQAEPDLSARGVQVQLISNLDTPVYIDQVLLRHALHHIFNVSLQQASRRSNIGILIESASEELVHIDFHNQGLGINEELQIELFNRFHQVADKQSWKRNGLGIGLFIARAIARAHGGDLMLLSRPGEGATFRLSIPVNSMQSKNDDPAPGETSAPEIKPS